MPMRLASPIAGRLIAVLKDYLPSELATIDSEEGGDPTPLPGPDGWFEWDRPLEGSFPAICVRDNGFTPVETRSRLMGGKINAVHEVDVLYHFALMSADENAESLAAHVKRGAAGIVRVLCIEHEGLDTVADPVRWPGLEGVLPTRVVYGPQAGQATGQQTRTAVVSIALQRIEYR